MKLTHDKVRALRDYHLEGMCTRHRAAIPVECSLCGRHAIGVALAEEWIAVRTAWWCRDDGGSFLRSSVAWFGSVGPDGDRGTWLAETDNGWQLFATEAEARAWLEEQARADGLEVAT
jgi:hypothetical protein